MNLKKNLNIIVQLALKDIKIKYNNSTFGYLWMVINPLLILVSLYVIFSIIIKLEVDHYQIFLLLGIIVWNFFSEATLGSINSIVSSMPLLKKVNVSLFNIILGANLSSLISFMINVFLLLCMMYFFKIPIFQPIRLIGLFYFLLLILIIISVSSIICVIYLYFKDITHIWTFALFIGFWITPIFYSETSVPKQFLSFYMLNPLARIISHIRNTVLYNYIDSPYQIMTTIIICSSIFFVSLFIYHRYSKKIYEVL
ncbi:ABC transporter permease [archaeon]|nr:ABC transporter permease [archaeon]